MQLYSLIVILWHLHAQEACWEPGQLGFIARADVVPKCACRRVCRLSKTMGLGSYPSMICLFHVTSLLARTSIQCTLLHIHESRQLYSSLCLCHRIVHAFCEEICSCLVNSKQHRIICSIIVCNQLAQYTSSTT